MTAITFDPSLLLSQPSLNSFISGNPEVPEILLACRPPAASTQGRTWSDSFIDTDELYYLAQCFFLTLSSYIVCLGCMTDLSKRLWVQSRHAMNSAVTIQTDKIFRDKLLVKSINTHRLDTEDFYFTPPTPTTMETSPTPNTLEFFHPKGMCRGMCHWFIHLYFKTRGMIPDTENHLRAVGQQFAEGAPRQAAFLNSLHFPPMLDLLRLNIRRDYYRVTPTEKTQDQIIAEFRLRPPGVYGIYTSSHLVVYIKVDESRQYVYDPTKGVVNVENAALFKNVMEPYFESHDNAKDIKVDLYQPR